VEGIERALCPLVSVTPAVVDLRDSSVTKILRNVQRDVTESSAFEHTSLGRIQRWAGAKSLLETLFSCRITEEKRPYDLFEYVQADAPLPEVSAKPETYIGGILISYLYSSF